MHTRIIGAHFYSDHIAVTWLTKDNEELREATLKRGGTAEWNLIQHLNKVSFTIDITAWGFSILPPYVVGMPKLTNYKLAENLLV